MTAEDALDLLKILKDGIIIEQQIGEYSLEAIEAAIEVLQEQTSPTNACHEGEIVTRLDSSKNTSTDDALDALRKFAATRLGDHYGLTDKQIIEHCYRLIDDIIQYPEDDSLKATLAWKAKGD